MLPYYTFQTYMFMMGEGVNFNVVGSHIVPEYQLPVLVLVVIRVFIYGGFILCRDEFHEM